MLLRTMSKQLLPSCKQPGNNWTPNTSPEPKCRRLHSQLAHSRPPWLRQAQDWIGMRNGIPRLSVTHKAAIRNLLPCFGRSQ